LPPQPGWPARFGSSSIRNWGIQRRSRNKGEVEREIGCGNPPFELEMSRTLELHPMATTRTAGDPDLPTGGGPAVLRDVAAVPPGQPISELPPPAAGRRPVRRRFLAPAVNPASHQHDRSPAVPDVRPRMLLRPPLVLVPVDADYRPADPCEPPEPLGRPSPAPEVAGAPVKPRNWHRGLGIGAGVAAVLALAGAAEIGASLDPLGRLRAVVWQHLAGAPAVPRAAEPPADPPGDPAQRVAYYTGRATAGDADAQLALAILYAKGEGVAQDYAAAANWFRGAAGKGAMRAQYDLGVLYERGRGVPLDHAEAVAWYRKAAAQNHPLAQYNLGVAFTKGEGVRRDFVEAAFWYHRAASQGVVAAMVNLAILYERGDGVDASTVDAYAWDRAAARRGSQPAARRADALLQAFSVSEQTRAEARTAEIAASIHDAIGERARLAAQGTPPGTPPGSPPGGPQSAAAAPAPALKSGIERGWNSTQGGETGAASR
jgi:hypothetical protein